MARGRIVIVRTWGILSVALALLALSASPGFAANSQPRASDPSLEARLQEAQARVTQLNNEIQQSAAKLQALNQVLDADQKREGEVQAKLGELARLEYQQPTLTLSNVLGAPSLGRLMDEVAATRVVAGKQQALIDEMEALRQKDQRARDDVAKEIAQMRADRVKAAEAAEDALGLRNKVAAALLAQAKAGDPFAGGCQPVVEQGFGPTTFGLEPSLLGFLHFHTGVDMSCAVGTPIHSVTDGVAHVTYGWGGGFGNNVVVETKGNASAPGTVSTYFVRYGHMLGNIPIQEGAAVHTGDVIGYLGSSGASTGPHLHFEVDVGQNDINQAVDPSILLSVG
jgi:murein DD-endopeptidase MepM/ murein hydrolase activator NlpD